MSERDVLAALGACGPGEQNALLFSDGSLSVFAVGWPSRDIIDERERSDRNETCPEHMTRIVRVRCNVISTIFEPKVSGLSAAQAEIARLEEQLAALRARQSHPAASEGEG